MTDSITWQDVTARRLARHRLDRPAPPGELPGVVGAMCGAHAQVMSAAELSVGLRTLGTTRTDVRDALWEDRTLVKAFGPRGTVHLLPTTELPLWTGALAAVPTPSSSMPRHARMDAAQTDAVVAAVADAVRDVEPPTIDELSEAVIARLGDWAADLVVPGFTGMWPRWRQALHTAGHRGAMCFGPNKGRKVTYTSPDRWLPGFAPAPAEEALAEVVRHYLHAYGPATSQQFAQWLSAPRRWAAELFTSLGDELRPVDVEGSPAWQLAADAGVEQPFVEHELRLMPYFDAYVVGSHPREQVFPGPAGERALSSGQAGTVQVMTIGGTAAGIWHQKRSGRKVELRVEAFTALDKRRLDELETQAQRVGEILEAKPVLTLGAVEAGKHL
ncbi:winged helix DNA-binding domain-containing protein [Streptomyces clavifer]|uniref:winged helix DNA-binding domain-containing protein n=1 Tax=Streptomyces clavifer TaxID=68188 RepID=UPI0033AAC144